MERREIKRYQHPYLLQKIKSLVITTSTIENNHAVETLKTCSAVSQFPHKKKFSFRQEMPNIDEKIKKSTYKI